jgi:hypothetical protein
MPQLEALHRLGVNDCVGAFGANAGIRCMGPAERRCNELALNRRRAKRFIGKGAAQQSPDKWEIEVAIEALAR